MRIFRRKGVEITFLMLRVVSFIKNFKKSDDKT
jgi:hypothetical protein